MIGGVRFYYYTAMALFNPSAAVGDNEHAEIECFIPRYTGSAGGSSAAATAPLWRRVLPVTVMRQPWPLISDVIIHRPNGMVRSMWRNSSADISSQLFAAADAAAMLSANAIGTRTNVTALLDFSEIVIDALQRAGLLDRPAISAKDLPPFQVLAPVGSRVSVIAGSWAFGASSTGGNPSGFSAGQAVTVGGAPCAVVWTTELVFHCTLPSWREACGGSGDPEDGGTCGGLPIAITTTHRVAAASGETRSNVRLSCPPLCPGGQDASLPYLVAASSAGAASAVVAVPAWFEASASAPSASNQVRLASPYQLARLFVTTGLQLLPPPCENSNSAPDLESGVCTDHTNNRSRDCLYGSGARCSPCATGALCPGGYRMWSRPGFYLPNEAAKQPAPCIEPALERCVGWDRASGTTQCGIGYKAGSPGCLRCAEHYYVDLDGSCEPCPSSIGRSFNAALVPLIAFAGGIVAFVAVNYAAVHLVVYLRGGTIKGGLGRAAQLTVWMLSLLQLVAQVCKTTAPGLPPELRRLIRFLDVFTFSGLVPPAACVPGAHSLSSQTNAIILSLTMLALIPIGTLIASSAEVATFPRLLPNHSVETEGLSLWMKLKRALPAKDTAKRAAPMLPFVLLSLVYPLAVKATFELLNCQQLSVPLISTLGMDPAGIQMSDGALHALFSGTGDSDELTQGAIVSSYLQEASSLRRSLSSLYSVTVLRLDSYFLCFKGEHSGPGVAAIICLFLFVILYPLGALWLIWAWYRPSDGTDITKRTICFDSPLDSAESVEFRSPSSTSFSPYASNASGGSAFVTGPLQHHQSASKRSSLHSRYMPLTAAGVAESTTYVSVRKWFLNVDLAALLFLTALLVFWPSPTTPGKAGGKFALTVLVLGPVTVGFLTLHPFDRDDVWKLAAKVCSLLLAFVSACLSCAQMVAGPQSREASALSHVVLALSALMFVLIVVAF